MTNEQRATKRLAAAIRALEDGHSVLFGDLFKTLSVRFKDAQENGRAIQMEELPMGEDGFEMRIRIYPPGVAPPRPKPCEPLPEPIAYLLSDTRPRDLASEVTLKVYRSDNGSRCWCIEVKAGDKAGGMIGFLDKEMDCFVCPDPKRLPSTCRWDSAEEALAYWRARE